MRTKPHCPTLPLPKSWPRRVRSAVIQVISLAHYSLITTRSWAANNWNARVRLKSQNERLCQELALLREEMRLKDERISRIPAQRRPHYTPIERLAILELRAARGWSQAQTAERLLVTPLTVASWTSRLDEGSPRCCVGRASIPARRRCAACCGMRLGSLLPRPPPRPRGPSLPSARTMSGISTSRPSPRPSGSGQPGCRSLCRSAGRSAGGSLSPSITTPGGSSASDSSPSSHLPKSCASFAQRAVRQAKTVPRHLVTDQGIQFRCRGFGRWCRRRGIAQRFGAIGKHGSIAVIERFIRTMKEECTRRLLVPYDRRSLQREIALYVSWYNAHRPHTLLGARTPNEVYSLDRRPVPRLDSSRDDPGRAALPVPPLRREFAAAAARD